MEISAVEFDKIPEGRTRLILMAKGKDGKPEPLMPLPGTIQGAVNNLLEKVRFECEPGEAINGVIGGEHILLAGMGEKKDIDTIYRCVSMAVRSIKASEVVIFAIAVKDRDTIERMARVISEGLIIATYKFTKAEKKEYLQKAYIVIPEGGDIKSAESGIHTGCIIAESVNISRDLTNDAGEDMSPKGFVDRVIELTKNTKIKVTVLDEKAMKEKGMNGILCVGKGSQRPPYLLIMELDLSRRGRGRKKKAIALVGKGLVFDSGGISIKPSQGMEEMKSDKAGASAVVGALLALERLKVKSRVIGIVPLAENMPGGGAYKPGDLVKMYSGKVVEIISTDAEGRLLLADSLAYASEMKPSIIIDIATLTGACAIALGRYACGVMGNNQKAVDALLQAADHAREKVWQLPLWEEYAEDIKSHFSHLKNSGGRLGGAITAAAFLKEFVGNTPWVHMDIAGVAWNNDPKPGVSAGATGFGVKTMVQYVLDRNR